MAGEVSKDLVRRHLLPEDIVAAHDAGLIHFHDADYFAQHMSNCCDVNLEDMLQNGTVISNTLIEKPHRFLTACNVATQIIAQIASSQYGGQSITLSHLSPFVDVSRQYYLKEVAEEMLTFPGVKRRFSEKIVADMTVVDDYAHHPAEIKATIDGARQKYPDKEIIAVFQPHTFTRTIALMDEFAEALDLADKVYLCDIFGSAREEQGNVKIEDLGAKIKKGGEVIKENNVSPLLDYHDAVVIFMGAGDVQKFEQAYEKLLSSTTKNVL